MVFGFIGILLALFVAAGLIPALWKMKQAELRAANGEVIPLDQGGLTPPEEGLDNLTGKISYFLLPLAVLMAATIYFDFDALKGALIANFFTFIYFAASRALSLRQISGAILGGFNTILFPIILVILAFALKLVNDDLQLVQYVINGVSPLMSKEMFPAVAFITLATIAFLTGSSWDLYVIAIPIIIPLAQSLDANVWMAVSVVVGAGAFGSNAAFYSDSTILTAASTNIPTMTHGITQLPYAATVLALTTLAYVVMGHLF
jgi:Na+/H+ antiporter NhaC